MLYMHQVAVESEQGQSDARSRIRKTEIKLQERDTSILKSMKYFLY